MDTEKEADTTRLRSILQNEQQKKVWHGIHCVTKSSCPNGMTQANILQVDRALKVCNTKISLKERLDSSLSERFGMAKSASIWHSALFELMGYLANTESA